VLNPLLDDLHFPNEQMTLSQEGSCKHAFLLNHRCLSSQRLKELLLMQLQQQQLDGALPYVFTFRKVYAPLAKAVLARHEGVNRTERNPSPLIGHYLFGNYLVNA
jgi:hypothetical protein